MLKELYKKLNLQSLLKISIEAKYLILLLAIQLFIINLIREEKLNH
jgi:hypothetical protein